MPSWQSLALTWVLKRAMKRRLRLEDIGPMRARIERIARRVRPHPLGARFLPAPDAPTPAEWVEPGACPGASRYLLYLHGGAYLFCSPVTHRPITAYLASHIPARVLVPEYRLAPEHPFPAALDDALSCYRWLLSQGIPARDISVAGDSAGGGLALAMMLALKAQGEPLPAAGACMSPWTDLAATGPSIASNSKRDAWVFGDEVAQGASLYLGNLAATHPLASPLYGDLAGFPSLLIHVSDSEVLLDDSVRTAERARSQGVQVDLQIWPGLPHVWQAFVPLVPEARLSLLGIARFLAQPPAESQP
ncbi:MAG TPA: alpha/beta hydrolase [bacterium]|nr:alpha/beta hydrolase [bacterium]